MRKRRREPVPFRDRSSHLRHSTTSREQSSFYEKILLIRKINSMNGCGLPKEATTAGATARPCFPLCETSVQPLGAAACRYGGTSVRLTRVLKVSSWSSMRHCVSHQTLADPGPKPDDMLTRSLNHGTSAEFGYCRSQGQDIWIRVFAVWIARF